MLRDEDRRMPFGANALAASMTLSQAAGFIFMNTARSARSFAIWSLLKSPAEEERLPLANDFSARNTYEKQH